MNWVRTFQVAALAFAIVAAYLVFADPRSDYLFPAVVLMVCSGFLSYRFHLKDRLGERRSAADLEDQD
jgi:hypothetical protein